MVSPLIALMKNQVDAIRQVSEVDGVAHFLASLNKGEVNKVKSDVKKAVSLNYYTLLLKSLTKKENIEFLTNITISFFAIDEAHCISE